LSVDLIDFIKYNIHTIIRVQNTYEFKSLQVLFSLLPSVWTEGDLLVNWLYLHYWAVTWFIRTYLSYQKENSSKCFTGVYLYSWCTRKNMYMGEILFQGKN